MRVGIFGAQVVDVARADGRQSQLVGQLEQDRIDLVVLLKARVLNLDVDVILAEDLHHQVELGPCRILVVAHDRLIDATRQAAAEGDQTLRMLSEQVEVDARLVVVALEIAERDELDEVVVPLEVLGQQREVRPVAAPRWLFCSTILDEVDLAANNRLDARFFGRPIEINGTCHRAVVGHRDRRHLELYRTIDEVLDTARTIENRVLGVTVQVDKLSGHGERSYRPGRRRVLISFLMGSDPFRKLDRLPEPPIGF